MSKIKRYDFIWDDDIDNINGMYERPNGSYVMYDDIKHLLNTSDSKLIAAAPEMLKILITFIAQVEHTGTCLIPNYEVKKLIEKVTGQKIEDILKG